MDLSNFGRDELEEGKLDNMLEEVGIDDVDSFVDDFRQQANQEAYDDEDEDEDDYDDEDEDAHEDEDEYRDEDQREYEDEDRSVRHASSQKGKLLSMGGALLNKLARKKHGGEGESGGNNTMNMMKGAMKAYKMLSGGSKNSSSSGGDSDGNFLDNIGSTYQNAKKMHALYKQFDKNGDGKITSEDIEIYLKEMGLGYVSPYLAKALFQAVDKNHNGSLDFTDLMALVTLLNKLSGKYGQVAQ